MTLRQLNSIFFLLLLLSTILVGGLVGGTSLKAHSHGPCDQNFEVSKGSDQVACLSLTWKKGPFLNSSPRDAQFSHLEAFFYDPTTRKVLKDHSFTIYPWMVMDNGHEHGTSYTTEIRDDGVILLKDIRFMSMPGYWQIRVGLEADGESKLTENVLLIPLFEGETESAQKEGSMDGHGHGQKH